MPWFPITRRRWWGLSHERRDLSRTQPTLDTHGKRCRPSDYGDSGNVTTAHRQATASVRGPSLGRLALGGLIDTQLPSNMGEFRWIREPPVRHHLPQGHQPRGREDKPRNRGRLIKAHQAAINQALGCRRQFWLIFLRAAPPSPQRKPSGDGRKEAEQLIKLAANVLALAWREHRYRGVVGGRHGCLSSTSWPLRLVSAHHNDRVPARSRWGLDITGHFCR